MLRSSSALLLAFAASPLFAQPTAIDHEFAIGFSDIRDVDDQFIGVSYRHYIDTVNIDVQPWSISPYLQRSNNVSVDYFGINDIDSINVRGEWFYSEDLVIRGRYGRITNDHRSSDDTLQRVGIDLSTFATPQWEYGAGLDYYHLTERYRPYYAPDDWVKETDTELSFSAFVRYTSFGLGAKQFTPGWDVKFEGAHYDDEFSIELDADYYFRRDWSVGVMVLHESNEGFGSDNLIELGTNYWFNAYSSIEFGLGYDTDESRLGSVTLLGTFRF